jgi:hypothetical protein
LQKGVDIVLRDQMNVRSSLPSGQGNLFNGIHASFAVVLQLVPSPSTEHNQSGLGIELLLEESTVLTE